MPKQHIMGWHIPLPFTADVHGSMWYRGDLNCAEARDRRVLVWCFSFSLSSFNWPSLFLKKCILLKYSWFTMLCLVSAVQQGDSVTDICIFFFIFLSLLRLPPMDVELCQMLFLHLLRWSYVFILHFFNVVYHSHRILVRIRPKNTYENVLIP